MNDHRELLDRAKLASMSVDGPEQPYEALLRRRDRKRRNQRIAAGVVGLAVFLAFALILGTVGLSDRPQGPAAAGADTGPATTGPAETGPAETGLAGTWSMDPLGTGKDEVVAHFDTLNMFVYVYADGRVITHEHRAPSVRERRLTSEGVDLVRSGAVGPDLFLSPSYDWSDLPEGAWVDHDSERYVPSRYAVCFYRESGDPDPENWGYAYPSEVLRFLPASAQAILRGEVTRGEAGTAYSPDRPECSAVTPEEVRALNSILHGVRVEDSEGVRIWWETDVVLPHGGRATCLTCG